MRSLTFIIGGLLLFLSGCAQTRPGQNAVKTGNNQQASDSNFIFEKMIPGKFTLLDADILGNIFVISADNQLKKLSPAGDSISVFNDVKKYGNPTYIDVSNPLKILVYYRNYATVVVLDRFLAFRNSINFRKENIFAAKAIATSYDNNIWLFDEQDFMLKKIKDDGTLLQESNDLRLVLDEVPVPQRIVDQNNYVYMYDPGKGFFIIDYYGAYKNNIPLKGWNNVAISGNTLYGFDALNLYVYNLDNPVLKSYKLPSFFAGYKGIKAIKGKLFLLMGDGVYIYSVK